MNALVAAVVIALAQVETPNGVPAHPGPAGETGPWQLTPSVRIDRGREIRGRGERVTDEAIATEQVLWLMRQHRANAGEPNMFMVAVAWNCGLTTVLESRVPVSSYQFAGRVMNLVEKQKETQ